MVEVLTKYLKDVFDRDPRKPARIAAYRGGYLPTERRATETRLRADGLDCVVTTNALELGVDIGALDVCLLNGFPGTIAGTWQRLGRAGRRKRPALGVLIATSDPLDQYVVRNPEFFTAPRPSTPHRSRPIADPDGPHPLRSLRAAVPGRRAFGKEPLPEMLDTSEARRAASGRAAVALDGRQLSRQQREPALGGGRQLRGGGCDRRQADIIAEVDYSSAA